MKSDDLHLHPMHGPAYKWCHALTTDAVDQQARVEIIGAIGDEVMVGEPCPGIGRVKKGWHDRDRQRRSEMRKAFKRNFHFHATHIARNVERLP